MSSVNFQPAFRGTIEAGPITERSSMPMDGVLIGYLTAALEPDTIVKKEVAGDKTTIEALIKKIDFKKIINVKGFEDRSKTKEPRKVTITTDKDSFEMVYNYPKEGNWFDKLTWKIDKEDPESLPLLKFLKSAIK